MKSSIWLRRSQQCFRSIRQQASQAASAQVRGRLPDGPQTEGHFLYVIETAEAQDYVPIGHVWFSINEREQVAWLQSFAINGATQDRETCGRAFTRMEAELAKRGIGHIQLYLAGNDERVLDMYLNHGFKIGGRHMTKRW